MKIKKQPCLDQLSKTPLLTYLDMPDKIATNIYTFMNYERMSKEAEENGLRLKEDKGYYEHGTMIFLRKIFQGKTKEETEELVRKILEITKQST